jgi:uroporphyrinogen-III synthase
MAPLALLTRPRADAEILAALLRARGVDSLIEPVIEILPLDGARLPPLAPMQALLLTSANGVRALAALLGPPPEVPEAPEARDLPLLAVGAATAEAARQAGFTNVEFAGGDVAALAALAKTWLDPARGPLLHIAGSRIAGDLAARLGDQGFAVERHCIYRAEASDALSGETHDALASGKIDMVLFFSPRSARAFVKLIRAAALESVLARITAICLSPAVAEEAAGIKWRRIRAASRPEQAALLDEVAREIKMAGINGR